MTRGIRSAAWRLRRPGPTLLAAALAIPLLFADPAAAVPVGLTGAPTPAFSMRMSTGFGYISRELDNTQQYRDRLGRLAIVGRASIMVHDHVEVIAGLHGMDASRRLSDFEGRIGLGGGGGARGWLTLQDRFGLNTGIGAVYYYTENRGTSPDPTIERNRPRGRQDDWLKEHQIKVDLTLSRSFQNWNFYGGALYNWVRIRQAYPAPDFEDRFGPLRRAGTDMPFGIFVGVDYFITPLVFFSMEGQNFHEDSLYASIGILIAP